MRWLAAVMCLIASPAAAQVPPGVPSISPQPPTLEQMVRDKIGADGLAILACQASVGALKAQLEAAQVRIRELEAAKTAPPKE